MKTKIITLIKLSLLAIVLFVLFKAVYSLFIYSFPETPQPQFSRRPYGYEKERADRHSPWEQTTRYSEYIHIHCLPQDTLEQLKLMLWYSNEITSGFQTPRKMKNKEGKNLTNYTIWFIDMSREKGHPDYRSTIGNVSLSKSWTCNDSSKWQLSITGYYDVEIDGRLINQCMFDIFDECTSINNDRAWGRELRDYYYKDLQNKQE